MHLSKQLLEMGCKVIGYDNLNDYYEVSLKESRLKILNQYEKFTFHKADLTDKSIWSDYLLKVRLILLLILLLRQV